MAQGFLELDYCIAGEHEASIADDGSKIEMIGDITDGRLTFSDLVPNTSYEIRVRMWSLKGPGTYTDWIHLTNIETDSEGMFELVLRAKWYIAEED